jgi:CheY-like chemotaxis protein
VLIADDDPPVRSALRRLLEGCGFVCAEAADGPETLEAARTWLPRHLLLDLAMPGLDGIGVAVRLRADPQTSSIHIHCLTGSADPADRERALGAGCATYFPKPVDVAKLLGVLGREAKDEEVGWVSGLTMSEARDLLDWLENHGCTRLEAQRHGERWAVGCVCPPGFRLGRDEKGAVCLLREETR